MQIGEQQRQGDLLITRINEIPTKSIAHIKPKQDMVVLSGEISGHDHKLKNGQVLLLEKPEPFDFSTDRSSSLVFGFLKLEEPSQLIHPEHDSVFLDTGVYEVRRQRERQWMVSD